MDWTTGPLDPWTIFGLFFGLFFWTIFLTNFGPFLKQFLDQYLVLEQVDLKYLRISQQWRIENGNW